MRRLALLPLVALLGCSAAQSVAQQPSPTRSNSPTAAATATSATPESGVDAHPKSSAPPELRVKRLATGLDHPWDVQSIGKGRLLISERAGTLKVWAKGTLRDLPLPDDLVWAQGETGLMSIAVDPEFAQTRRIYMCMGGYTKSGNDVRITRWSLNASATKATYQGVVLKGLPSSSGRHGGCRLLILDDGSMLVGTGDAAIGTNPQDLTSLGGKTLRLDPVTGKPWPDNPFSDAANRNQRYVHTFGHRNVQGLAVRADGTWWSAEHGPDVDDEVNRLVSGGDYGWNPVPGYNEAVPMTDQDLPGDQIDAAWSSGDPTVATGGQAFVDGDGWGWYDGTLAVAALKASKLMFLRFDADGELVGVREPTELKAFGRLRSVTRLPGGALLVTTDNGAGEDAVLKVRP